MSPSSLSSGLRLAAGLLVTAIAVLAVWSLLAQPASHHLLWRHWGVPAALVAIAFSALAGAALTVWLAPAKRTRRAFAVAALGGATGFCLLVLELPTLALGYDYGRIFAPISGETWLSLSDGVNQPDSELLHIHWPNSGYQGEVVGNLVRLGIPTDRRYPVDLRYDGNGFRNDSDLERADIAAIGDSFVEAALMPLDATVSHRIGQKLGLGVANLGQSAYGLRQELVVLKRYALPLQPQWVLWFLFGGNDLRDVRNYEDELEHFGEEKPVRPLRERSFVRNALFALSQLTMPRSSEVRPAALERGALYARGEVSDTLYVGGPTRPWSEYDWQVTIETLSEARRLSEANAARFLLVYIPRKYTVYADLVEAPPDSPMHDWQLVNLHDALGDWARETGTDYVDLVAPLRAAARAGDSPYFVDDVHWNSRGHEIAAEQVAAFIREASPGSASP